MALKGKITEEEYTALSEPLKAEYKKGTSDNADLYLLDTDIEDVGEMRRARDREKFEAAEAKKRADKAEADLAEERKNAQRGSGDIAALEKSWKEQREREVAAAQHDRDEKVKAANKNVRKVLIDNVAQSIAAKIATVPALIIPLLKARLDVNFDTEEPTTRVLGLDGKPSALTVAELTQEFVDNKEFAPIIRATNASGGGTAGVRSGGGAPKKPSEFNDAERAKLARDDPAKFRELFPAANVEL